MKLSSHAIEVLREIKAGSKRVDSLESKGYDQSMVNRAALELEEKGLLEVEEEEVEVERLTKEGEELVDEGSPEWRLIERVRDAGGEEEIANLQDLPVDVALGKARQKGWIEIESGTVVLTPEGEEGLEGGDGLRQKLESGEFNDEARERGLVESETSTERSFKLTEKGESIDPSEVEEEFNVEARVETPRTGKKHFYKEIIDFARRKWTEMGFEEMSGDFVVSSFLNFDALYTPQDHPARELQDTFYMEKPEKTDLSEFGDKIDRVRETHENGWTTGSTGWNYDWSREDAEKNVLRTHTTAVSARKLHEIDVENLEDELPKKYFTVSRNFRNETIDRTHLPEFLQTDGIVVGRDLNFTHLKGYLTEFFSKMGYDEVRLVPSYYPYTEMSTEVQVYDEQDEEWMGLGGSGLFRPEVVKPLLGFEATVLAWGLGIPRIAMKAAGIEDIRELYKNDIELIEETPVWRPGNRSMDEKRKQER